MKKGNKAVGFHTAGTTPDAVLTQSFATIPGQSYVLSFDLGIWRTSISATGEQRMKVTVGGKSILFSQSPSIYSDGSFWGPDISNKNIMAPEVFPRIWHAKILSFMANSSTTTLKFQDVSPVTNNIEMLLHEVSVMVASEGDCVGVNRNSHSGFFAAYFGCPSAEKYEREFNGWFGRPFQQKIEGKSIQAIYQSFETVPGGIYDLTFFLRNDAAGSARPNKTEHTFFRAMFDGLIVFDLHDPPGFAYRKLGFDSRNVYDPVLYSLVASGNEMTVLFLGYNDQAFFYLDDVAVRRR